ncbi:MAG: hypothetical protein N2255_11025, partial [Kiritimatiellae bacterium]|nr:hypothetical protein [Kiritimatiellia bacterium]
GVLSEAIWEEKQDIQRENVVSDFVQAIRAGTPPRTDLERSLILQKITDAIYASAATGTCVALT